MDFSITPEQEALYEATRKFAEKEVFPTVLERDKSGRWDPAIWKKMAAQGLIGAPIPVEYGGSGLSALDTCLAKEAFAFGGRDGGVGLAWGASTILCAVPIWKLGTEAQKQRYLPKMCSGDWVGGFCLSEPGSGSDAAAMKTRAEKKGDRWILNGTKMWITNGPVGNHFVVTAVTDPDAKAFGISTFIVEKDFKGFRVGQHIEKMGVRTSATSELVFEDCEVPEENMLGEPGTGFVGTVKLIFGWERSCLLAPSLGGMRGHVEHCAAYAHERKQFGKPIAKFQAVRHMLADMKIRYEISRNLLHRVAWQLDTGQEPPLVDAAIAKTYVSEATQKVARDAVQIFGGNGFTVEYHAERGVRDSMLGTIGGGTSEIQRSIIARALLDLGY